MKLGFYQIACLAAVGIFTEEVNAVLLKEERTTKLASAAAEIASGASLASELQNLNKQFAEIEANIELANKTF